MLNNFNEVYGSFIAGHERKAGGRDELIISNPFNSEKLGTISCATLNDLKDAIINANDVFHSTLKVMPSYKRSEILRKTADLLEQRSEEFARVLTLEAGKPIRESRGEVQRAIQVLRFSSEGAKNLQGEQIPMDSAIGGENQIGIMKRVPLGVVAAITPFNFPLNLVLHKIGPAIAAGNTIVLKPAEKTPLSTVFLYKLFVEAGLPDGAINIIMGSGQNLVEPLVTHKLIRKVTFTGSGPVGWMINNMAVGKRVTLELGSNAPNIIFKDADLENAVNSIMMGGFTYAGQACVSAQRIYVHESIIEAFKEKIISRVNLLEVGDPLNESTDMGPMITEESAIRTESWINEAKKQGAEILIGGNRFGAILEPTVLSKVTKNMKVVCEEVFAPVISIIPFLTNEEVLEWANDSDFGLHAGVFTKDINLAFKFADLLEASGVWINEVSVKRYDHIPYGGIKQSGIGKEGVKYAINEMTDLKFIGIKLM